MTLIVTKKTWLSAQQKSAFSVILLSVVMLSVVLFYSYVKCRYAECRYAECRYAESRYAECRYAQCCGTHMGTYSQQFIFFTTYSFCNKLECLFLARLSSLI
jgi:hypothetical protein